MAHNKSVGIITKFIDQPVTRTARETDTQKFKDRIFAEIDEKFANFTFDIILVDLHIGEEFEGGEVVRHIRKSQTMYRPIIFFSGGQPAKEGVALKQLNASIAENDLAGKSVFRSTRGAKLNADLRKICTEMHKEEHKLNAFRGLLMDRTSEIDAMILNYITDNKNWKNLKSAQTSKIYRKIKSNFQSKHSGAENRIKFLSGLTKMDFDQFKKWLVEADRSDIIRNLDSFDRNKILRALLKFQPEFETNSNTHSTYFQGDTDHICTIRNEYGHQTEEEIGEAHNPERCKHIRTELTKHIENLNSINF